MKRDMDLCREILRRVEERSGFQDWFELEIEGRSREEVSYHVKILSQAGLLEAHEDRRIGLVNWFPMSLTWSGQEFLAAARDDTLWNKAKFTVVSTTGGLAFEFLQAWLKREAAQRLGIEL